VYNRYKLILGEFIDLIQRPSKKELFNKIKQGKEIVDQGSILPIDPDVIAEDAIELGYQVSNLKGIMSQLFDEIKIEHYVGAHPPRKSYEPIIKDCELFEFKWKCRIFGCDTYLKYCLKGETFYLVSLHKDRPQPTR
jgi:hypothetical protein